MPILTKQETTQRARRVAFPPRVASLAVAPPRRCSPSPLLPLAVALLAVPADSLAAALTEALDDSASGQGPRWTAPPGSSRGARTRLGRQLLLHLWGAWA
ncbi:hypothetical protein GMDG_03178 [Pseudogymnoascus destructans 20631-21]|uniref:Uncharacterized protein n=1 Tax=Pseudogymnoascus destructans (strain ATCC MYA-4855 / 20631-21) TaxID=658429 RepID=L8G6A8_PSED2|nr:hypothetical protein GMDG_03178 [Pseudogymnoascus destructans 20631-21]